MIITGDDKETAKPNKLNTNVLRQINTVVKSNKNEIETVTPNTEIKIKDSSEDTANNSVNTVKQNDVSDTIELKKSPAKKTEPETEASQNTKKRNYSDTVILNLPGGERSEFKAFCAKYQVTMTDFIYFAMDYIRNGVEEKKFSLSRSGIREISNE